MRTFARWTGRVACALALVALATVARPTWLLHGTTSTLIVSGHSMDGTYRTGDLIVVRTRATYHVGDIVGFQVPKGEAGAGMVVIHRLHALAGGRFSTKGDNNPDPDPWTIAPSDIRGGADLRLAGVGNALAIVRGPLGVAGLFGGLAAWVALGMLPTPTASTRRDEHEQQQPAAT